MSPLPFTAVQILMEDNELLQGDRAYIVWKTQEAFQEDLACRSLYVCNSISQQDGMCVCLLASYNNSLWDLIQQPVIFHKGNIAPIFGGGNSCCEPDKIR